MPASSPARGWATPRPVYRPRRPPQRALYPVVQHYLETFLAQAAEADTLGDGVPPWVERDFRAYLKCGHPRVRIAACPDPLTPPLGPDELDCVQSPSDCKRAPA